jgi:hypothetical protein
MGLGGTDGGAPPSRHFFSLWSGQERDLLAEPGALEELTRRARAVPALVDVPGDPPDPAGMSEWRVRRLGRGAAAVTLRLPADRAERIDGWLREVEAAARRAMEP